MPHVIIRNPPAPEAFHRAFQPWKVVRDDGTILEAKATFLRGEGGNVVLVEVVCIELGPPQHFFVSVERKKQQVTVRCYPFPSPHRTPGVKELVARVARDVLALGGEVEKTNLDL